jgi:hypothetical protein
MYDLTIPVDFLCCYSFLCSLSKKLSEARDELESPDAEAMAASCTNYAWFSPPPPPKEQGTKRRRPNDKADDAAGPSGAGNEDRAADRDVSEMRVNGLVGGINVDGYDDLDAEESAAWVDVVETWHNEAATMPVSNKLSETNLKVLPLEMLVYDRRQGLIQWRSEAGQFIG